MVSGMQDRHVVIAGMDTALGREMARHYRGIGARVTELAVGTGEDPDAAAGAVSGDIDLLVVADDTHPPDRSAGTVTRDELSASLLRLTFAPMRIAALLKPQLAGAEGTLVLLSRLSATMPQAGGARRYLERPFRAATHALWRCMSVEWREAGIACRIVVLADGEDAAGRIADAIALPLDRAALVEPIDISGAVRSW